MIFKLACGKRSALMAGVALGVLSTAPAADARTADEGSTLSEVVVTAQKRAQNLQDVPVSITAMTADALQANRITNMMDLNALAPNLSTRRSAGGNGIPSFTMRGIVTYGVVPGSDKSVSIYIDGVYLGATKGTVFDLPDVDRIEVLRGPQGTLFGRNSTAGAISVITRDPPGVFGVRQEFTYGNYDQLRSKTQLDLPEWGPLSASITYVHDERRGDVRNLGAGTRWDRTGMRSKRNPISVSPNWLGDKNSESVFTAVKFEPSDTFSAIYKFDYSKATGSDEAEGLIATNPAGLGPAGALFAQLLATQPTPVLYVPSARRPKAVNNWWMIPYYSKNYGHNITTKLEISDSISLKNILAYRKVYAYSANEYGGIGRLVNTVPAFGPLGAPFVMFGNNNESTSTQWSNEVQLNYDSKWLTLTMGGIYFKISDHTGPPPGLVNFVTLTALPGFRVPVNFPAVSQSYNIGKSAAAYAQAEFHVSPIIDLVGGYRITRDRKSGTLYNPQPLSFTYKKSKPSYLAGVNIKPTSDILLYAKYTNGFVSGGQVSDVTFLPETARSWEAGLKADLFDRRLRTNLSVFHVKYSDLQSAQAGFLVGRSDIPLLVVDLGDAKAKGFELEVVAAPARNLSLGGGLGYSDFKYTKFTPLATRLLGPPETYLPTLRPKWTGQLWGQYATDPLFGEARVRLRLDANWHSKQRLDANPFRAVPAYRVLQYGPAAWTVNGRVGLEHIKAGGADVEVAAWVKNLTNDRSPMFANLVSFFATSTFVPARTFGIDVNINY